MTTRTINPLASHHSNISTAHIHGPLLMVHCFSSEPSMPEHPLVLDVSIVSENEDSLSSSAEQTISTERHNAALSRCAVLSASSLEVLCCFDAGARCYAN